MAGTQYTLRVINNSTNFVDMCMYQEDPNIGNPNVLSLAWFAKPAFPTTTVIFRWTVDYSFLWSETGELVPGAFFDASQIWPADPANIAPSTPSKGGNQIGLDYKSGAYNFTSTPAGNPQTGTLYVKENDQIPLKQASVGIGMSGAGTFAVQAQPRTNLTFTPHPVYYLAAGTFAAGEVLDIGSISNPTDIRFPAGVFSMTATLNEGNDWAVVPTKGVNAVEHKRIIADQRGALVGANR